MKFRSNSVVYWAPEGGWFQCTDEMWCGIEQPLEGGGRQLYDSDPGQIAQTQLLLDKVGAALNDLTRKRADLDRAMRDLKDIRAKCIEHLKTQKT